MGLTLLALADSFHGSTVPQDFRQSFGLAGSVVVLTRVAAGGVATAGFFTIVATLCGGTLGGG